MTLNNQGKIKSLRQGTFHGSISQRPTPKPAYRWARHLDRRRHGHAATARKVRSIPGSRIARITALLANIIASGTISSAPDGENIDYIIALSNSRASTAAIGTFWYAGVPSQDYLRTNPISVAPPPGWTARVIHSGSRDGYAIQFVASSAAYDVQPGSSLIFSFLSADPPLSVEGGSDFYNGVPVGTSFVYQHGPQSGASDEFAVASAASLQSIAVTPGNASLATAATTQFTAIGTFSDNSTQNLTNQVTWSSSASSVATVSNTLGSQGLATVNGPGSTTISASLNGISGSTKLTGTAVALQSIRITPARPFVGVGHTEQFTATGTYSDNTTQDLTSTVTWSSGITAVATISSAAGSRGLATAVGVGTSTIAATSGGITANTVIAVTPALQSIQVTPADRSVPKGETEQFRATAVFANNSTEDITNQVTWASSNTVAAAVSNRSASYGIATGLATGTSTISAMFEGMTGSTILTVSPAALVSISVAPSNPSVIAGGTDQFTATGHYSDSSTQNVTSLVSWESTPSSVATISPSGLASGVAQGAATISATYQGITSSAGLSVSPPLVTLQHVATTQKKHKVTSIVLTFSGGLESSLAQSKALYRLVIAGKRGSFTAKNAKTVKVRNVQYNAALSPDTVTIVPTTPFALSKQVEFIIYGLPPSGLEDGEGRFIDGNKDGQPGGNAIAILSKAGATIKS